jgi:hypothetical protein
MLWELVSETAGVLHVTFADLFARKPGLSDPYKGVGMRADHHPQRRARVTQLSGFSNQWSAYGSSLNGVTSR